MTKFNASIEVTVLEKWEHSFHEIRNKQNLRCRRDREVEYPPVLLFVCQTCGVVFDPVTTRSRSPEFQVDTCLSCKTSCFAIRAEKVPLGRNISKYAEDIGSSVPFRLLLSLESHVPKVYKSLSAIDNTNKYCFGSNKA
jgi:hypothetical protein